MAGRRSVGLLGYTESVYTLRRNWFMAGKGLAAAGPAGSCRAEIDEWNGDGRGWVVGPPAAAACIEVNSRLRTSRRRLTAPTFGGQASGTL